MQMLVLRAFYFPHSCNSPSVIIKLMLNYAVLQIMCVIFGGRWSRQCWREARSYCCIDEQTQVHHNFPVPVGATQRISNNGCNLLQSNCTRWFGLNLAVKQVFWVRLVRAVMLIRLNSRTSEHSWPFLLNNFCKTKTRHFFFSSFMNLCDEYSDTRLRLIWWAAFRLVYDRDKIAPLLLCCCDIVNFCSVYHYSGCLFATVLFIPWIPVYFQAIGCCLVVIKKSSSMKVLLFWRRTEFRH